MQLARHFFRKPAEKTIQEFVCNGCGEHVVQKELIIPVGPLKGETTIANYGCKCEDIKLARRVEKASKRAEQRKLQKTFDYYSLVNHSLQQATLENYEPTNQELAQAKREITDYINNFDGTKNLLLHGSYGTGKSHLSIAVTKKLMEKGYQCLFLSLPKLLTKIKETYNNDGVTEDELLNMIQQVDLLVLDDIGAEHNTDWVNAKLFEVLDSRAGKATIYTTNLNSQQLRKQINERNFSRMMENTEIIRMNGRDYRRRKF